MKNLHQAQSGKREKKNLLRPKLCREHLESSILMTEDGMTHCLSRSDVSGEDYLNLPNCKPPLLLLSLYFLQKETVFANVLQFKSQTEHGGMAQCYRTYLDGII